MFICYLYFRSHQELRRLLDLGYVLATCPGERTGPTLWTECGVTRLASTQSKGNAATSTYHAVRKSLKNTKKSNSAPFELSQTRCEWGCIKPPGRQLRLQDPSRPGVASEVSPGCCSWSPASNQLSPHHWHQGSGCMVPGPPPALFLVNTEGVRPHGHSLPSNLLSWLRTTCHRDYLPLPPSLDT